MANPNDTLPYSYAAEPTATLSVEAQSTADAGTVGYVVAPSYPSLLHAVHAVVTTASATATGTLTLTEQTNSKQLATLDHATTASAGDLLTGTITTAAILVPANAVILIDTSGSGGSASGVVNLRLEFSRTQNND